MRGTRASFHTSLGRSNQGLERGVDTGNPSGVLSEVSNIRSISLRGGGMTRLYEDRVTVEREAGMPAAFLWRGRRYEVSNVIGRWRIEGRWWEDGRDREYWRVEARGGAVVDLFEDRRAGGWQLERLWD
jgi:hypothetical protein